LYHCVGRVRASCSLMSGSAAVALLALLLLHVLTVVLVTVGDRGKVSWAGENQSKFSPAGFV
jgi:hypothetical protein